MAGGWRTKSRATGSTQIKSDRLLSRAILVLSKRPLKPYAERKWEAESRLVKEWA